MTTELPPEYAFRCFKALGQGAHDPQQVAHWCYDNPARKPLEKANGERTRPIYVSQKVFSCLLSVARSISDGESVKVDAIAESLLCRAVKDMAPKAWEMHERHEAEAQKLLAELRRNEPDLEPDTIRAGSIEHDDCGSR